MSIPVSPGTASSISRYWKAVVAAIGVLSVVGAEIVQAIENGAADGTFDTTDMIKIAFIVLTAIGVYAAKNTTPAGQAPDPNISEAEGDTPATQDDFSPYGRGKSAW